MPALFAYHKTNDPAVEGWSGLWRSSSELWRTATEQSVRIGIAGMSCGLVIEQPLVPSNLKKPQEQRICFTSRTVQRPTANDGSTRPRKEVVAGIEGSGANQAEYLLGYHFDDRQHLYWRKISAAPPSVVATVPVDLFFFIISSAITPIRSAPA